ncbi:MAG: heavy-metal-associated domain-containing protein [Acidobacteria bacterium]|nr:heavy-metal-associated domain-containing protein [Acidobacteriota bacterium]
MHTADFEHGVSDPQRQSRATRFVVGALLLFGVVLGAYFLTRASQEQTRALISHPPARTVTLPIEGMTCASCTARVKKTLKSIDGVTEIEVSLEQRAARVRYLGTKVSPERLAAAINELGYRAGTPTEERAR